jgi:hypothetical protein
MKAKFTAVAVVLAVAIVATAVAANLFGSARPIPMPPGDPMPGIDVLLETSPGATLIGTEQTDANGIAKFPNVAPGDYVVKTSIPSSRTSSNYNSSRSNTAGLAGATIVSGDLTFDKNKSGRATIRVAGPGQKTITLTAKVGPDAIKAKPTPNPAK